MAIPTEQDFEEYAQATGAERLADAMREIAAPESPSLSAIEAFLRSLVDVRTRVLTEACALPVGVWNENQATSDRAYRALAGRGHVHLSIEEQSQRFYETVTRPRTEKWFQGSAVWSARSAEKLALAVENANSSEGIAARHRRHCQRHLNWVPWREYAGIACAFSAYFYSERFRQLGAQVQAAKEFAEFVKVAIDRFKKGLPDNPFVPAFTGVKMQNAYMTELRELLATNVADLPIQRIDTTARERCLAFDLWRAIYNAHGRSRPKAVAYFMEFEGVKYQPDIRDLERQAKRWKERVPRYLIRQEVTPNYRPI